VPLFAIAVPAIFGGDAAWYAARPLATKGYEPFLYANVFMPNNLYPVPRPDQVPRIVRRAAAKVDRLAPLIHERRRHIEGVHPLGWLGGYLQRWGFAPVERGLQRFFFADESCTGCGWCVANCPTSAIERIEDSIRFRDGCILCARCFHRCPQHAIQYTKATRNQAHFRRYAGPQDAERAPEEGA
jgi:ferredoxin